MRWRPAARRAIVLLALGGIGPLGADPLPPEPRNALTQQLLAAAIPDPAPRQWQLCLTDARGWNNFDACLASLPLDIHRRLRGAVADSSLHHYLQRQSADQGGVTLQLGGDDPYSLILLNTAFLDQAVYTDLLSQTYVLAPASRAQRVLWHELGHVAPEACQGRTASAHWQPFAEELEADLYLFYRAVSADGDYRRISDWIHRRNLGLLATTPDLHHWSSYTLLALMAKYRAADIRQWPDYRTFRQALCDQPGLFLTERQLLELNTLVQRRLVAGTRTLKNLNRDSQLLLSATLYGTLHSVLGESGTANYLAALALVLPDDMAARYRRHPISTFPLQGVTVAP